MNRAREQTETAGYRIRVVPKESTSCSLPNRLPHTVKKLLLSHRSISQWHIACGLVVTCRSCLLETVPQAIMDYMQPFFQRGIWTTNEGFTCPHVLRTTRSTLAKTMHGETRRWSVQVGLAAAAMATSPARTK